MESCLFLRESRTNLIASFHPLLAFHYFFLLVRAVERDTTKNCGLLREMMLSRTQAGTRLVGKRERKWYMGYRHTSIGSSTVEKFEH